jgi:hypothetical protein
LSTALPTLHLGFAAWYFVGTLPEAGSVIGKQLFVASAGSPLKSAHSEHSRPSYITSTSAGLSLGIKAVMVIGKEFVVTASGAAN